MAQLLKDWALVVKKTFSHPKADEQARLSFQERIASYKTTKKKIVYIDESGFANDMPRSYGYSAIGKKCLDKRNWHEKGRINAIGAITDFHLITVTLFTGSINSQVFLLWITDDLLPTTTSKLRYCHG